MTKGELRTLISDMLKEELCKDMQTLKEAKKKEYKYEIEATTKEFSSSPMSFTLYGSSEEEVIEKLKDSLFDDDDKLKKLVSITKFF